MRTFIIGFLIFCAWTLFTRWYYVCKVELLCDDKQEIVDTISDNLQPRTKDLQLLDDGGVSILKNHDQFGFAKNMVKPELNLDNDSFLNEVAKYLKANKGDKVRIVGSYMADETNETMFDNLGLARAAAIKDILIKKGVDKKRFDLSYKEVADEAVFSASPAYFTILKKKDDGKEIVTAEYSFTNMTYLDANFKVNSAVFEPGANFKRYADSVSTYLEKNKEKNLTIIGHTDNTGNQTYNDKLGSRRARATKNYFVETLKVKEGRIKTASKGEREPISTNETEEGRQKNRRINLVIE